MLGYSIFGSVVLLIILGVVLLFFKKTRMAGKIILTFLTSVVCLLLSLAFVFAVLIASPDPVVNSVLTTCICIMVYITLLGVIWGFIKKKQVYIPICLSAIIIAMGAGGFWGYKAYVNNIETISEDDRYGLLESYAPYGEYTKIATLDEVATLRFSTDFPKMDGATAMYPIYSSFARATYPKFAIEDVVYGYESVDDCLCCTTTTNAYQRIVDKEADIIFVGGPSKEQEQYAKDNGVELVYTPIGREAFVFFVNSKNSMNDITVSQIQDIYSGEIDRWSDLNVYGLGKIRAFQRDEGSGSQTALIQIMGDKPLMEPPNEDIVSGMGGIIEKTSDYRNFKNAIGYSFRFYSTEMVENNQIKLLSINGVYPSLESIEDGTYPLASEFYAVTRSDADENTKKLLNWVLSDQGQELISKTGYTPINN